MKEQPAVKRFLAKVNKVKGSCWLWTGYRDKGGHGRFYYKGKTIYAHRAGLILLMHLKLEPTDIVCHLCEVPNCVRPTHLKVADHSLNQKMAFVNANTKRERSKLNGRLIPLKTIENDYITKNPFVSSRKLSYSPFVCKHCNEKGEQWELESNSLTYICPCCGSREIVRENWYALNEDF